MVTPSKSESGTVNFGPYIEELHEFFTSRSVSFGTANDIVPFARRLSTSAPFRSDTASMVRAIIYREGENLSRSQLLELLALAVGGPPQEDASPEVLDGIRQLSAFVGESLRRKTIPDDPPPEAGEPEPQPSIETPPHAVAPGNAPFVSPVMEDQASQDVPSATQVYTSAPREPQKLDPDPDLEPVYPPPRGVFSRAAAMPASSNPSTPRFVPRSRPGSSRKWLIPAVAAALLLLGVTVYFTRSAHSGASVNGLAKDHGLPGAALGNSASLVAKCVGPTTNQTSQVSRQALDDRYRRAHTFLNEKLSDALPQLREVARLDPGYPGINLDLADSLMQMKRVGEARDAIDSQISISECLSRLPLEALDSYCKAEFSEPTTNCQPQLVHIWQAAQLQAALIHFELGRNAGFDPAKDMPIPDTAEPPPPRIFASAPPRRQRDAAVAHSPVHPAQLAHPAQRPASHSNSPDKTLMQGEGTDAGLGAYSKD